MRFELLRRHEDQPGEKGLPEDYPVPPDTTELLFFIQRNQNEDTIIYEVNRDKYGQIDPNLPMVAYWKQYTKGGIIKGLNYIQNKLAYGYSSQKVDEQLIRFNFVSYQAIDFYIQENGLPNIYIVTCKINKMKAVLKNIYIYAHELGVFPDVKFIELYGEEYESGIPVYEKLFLEK